MQNVRNALAVAPPIVPLLARDQSNAASIVSRVGRRLCTILVNETDQTTILVKRTPVALRMIEGARASGLDVTTEAHPYTAAATWLEAHLLDRADNRNVALLIRS